MSRCVLIPSYQADLFTFFLDFTVFFLLYVTGIKLYKERGLISYNERLVGFFLTFLIRKEQERETPNLLAYKI